MIAAPWWSVDIWRSTFYHGEAVLAMTTNGIAAEVKAGQTGYLELWEAVRRFVHDQSYRWAAALNGLGGVDNEDLQQTAFLALLEAVEGWESEKGAFLTIFGLKLKTAFSEATGLRTKRDRQDPLQAAVSLDAPLAGDEGALTLADTLEDPSAAAEIDGVAERDFQQRRREALAAALATLPEAQRAAVVGRCCCGQKVEQRAYSAALRALRHPRISQQLMRFL